MSSPRPLLALAGGVLVIVLASLGGVAYVTLRTGPLAERLVRDVEALARTRYPRPSHVTPAVPGTFAQHLDPLMGEVLRLYRERSEAFQSVASDFACLGVIEGREPVSALPAGCREEWKKGRDVMARVLAATQAEEGGLPEDMGDLASPEHPYAPGRPALLYVIRLAALETRLLLAEGRTAAAVDTCLDALALSRELTLGGGLIGEMNAAAGEELIYRPCAEALDAAPMERKRAAVAQLSRLEEGHPPFSHVLKQESVAMQLVLFGERMPSELLAALPTGARDVALRKWPDAPRAPASPVTARRMWRQLVEAYDALIPVADRAPEARQRAFEDFDARSASALFPVEGPSGANYSEYAKRVDLARLQHDALIALVEADLKRMEEGRWPERVTSRAHRSFVLESTHLGEARLKPCAPSLAAQSLRVTADVPSGAWVQQTP